MDPSPIPTSLSQLLKLSSKKMFDLRTCVFHVLSLIFRYMRPTAPLGPGSVSASASQQGLHYSYYHFLTPFNSDLGNKIMFFSYCTHCSIAQDFSSRLRGSQRYSAVEKQWEEVVKESRTEIMTIEKKAGNLKHLIALMFPNK